MLYLEMDVHVGIKLVPLDREIGQVERFLESASYLELGFTKIEGALDSVRKLRRVLKERGHEDTPLVIHAPHMGCGFNPSDRAAWDHSENLLKESFNIANEAQTEILVVHPGGAILSRGGDRAVIKKEISEAQENMSHFFERFFEKHSDAKTDWVHFENCTVHDVTKDGKIYYYAAFTPKDIGKICKDFGFSMTLDFTHAAVMARQLGKSHSELIESFLKEQPKGRPFYSHISGADYGNEFDQHLHLGDSRNTNFKFLGLLSQNLPSDSQPMITLETFQYLNPEKSFREFDRDVQIIFQAVYGRKYSREEAVRENRSRFPQVCFSNHGRGIFLSNVRKEYPRVFQQPANDRKRSRQSAMRH